jgi:toxin ParE1/3/4
VKAQVFLTQGAEDDLLGIYRRRLAQRGANGKDGADNLLNSLIDATTRLADHPLSGPVPLELELLGIKAYRQLSQPPFRLIYWPELDLAKPQVTVMLIADARRDFRVLLEERLLRMPPHS